MDKRVHIEKNSKIICIIFSLAFIVTLISYLVLTDIYHSRVYYLGIVSLVLLFPFLLSVAYVMVVSAKHALDKEIERKEEELKRQNVETNSEKKK